MPETEEILTLTKALLELRREQCKTLARLHALEAVMLEAVPESDRARVHARVNQLGAEFHQRILEQFEKYSPHTAAILDDRKLDELL